mgnify:CR=1 FL=1
MLLMIPLTSQASATAYATYDQRMMAVACAEWSEKKVRMRMKIVSSVVTSSLRSRRLAHLHVDPDPNWDLPELERAQDANGDAKQAAEHHELDEIEDLGWDVGRATREQEALEGFVQGQGDGVVDDAAQLGIMLVFVHILVILHTSLLRSLTSRP